MIIASGFVEVNDPICSVTSYYALRVTQWTSGDVSSLYDGWHDNLHFRIQVQTFINAGASARIILIPRVRAEAWWDNEAPYFQAWVRHFLEWIWSMSKPDISFFWITCYALFFPVLLIRQSRIDSIYSKVKSSIVSFACIWISIHHVTGMFLERLLSWETDDGQELTALMLIS